MDLKFFIDRYNVRMARKSNYKDLYDYIPLPAPTAYLRMGQDAILGDYSPIYVNTVVEERWIKRWWCAKHWWRIGCNHPNHLFVMCLDCDNEYGMLAAARILKMNNIGYAVIKSSNASDHEEPGNWFNIFGPQGVQGVQGGPQGIQGPQGSLVKIQQTDHFWIVTDYVAPMPHLVNVMRTIPGVDNKFIDYCDRKQTMFLRAHPKYATLPVFSDSHTLVTQSAIEWYEAFKAHFESPKMKAIVMTRKLRNSLGNPAEFSKMIHDPNFEV